MGLQDHLGIKVPRCEFVLDSDLFGRKLTEEQQREFVDSTAKGLAAILEKVAAPGGTIEVQIFRRRGVRGEGPEASLPPRDLWGVQLLLWTVEVQRAS